MAQIFSGDTTEIADFIKRWDKDGFAVYRCVSPLRDGATTRSLETVAEVTQVVVDIDCKDLVDAAGRYRGATPPPSATADRSPRERRRVSRHIQARRNRSTPTTKTIWLACATSRSAWSIVLAEIRRRAMPPRCCASSGHTTRSVATLSWSRHCGAAGSRSTSPTSRRWWIFCRRRDVRPPARDERPWRRTHHQRARPGGCRRHPRRDEVRG